MTSSLKLPAIVVDEIVLPGARTELVLDPGERRHLEACGASDTTSIAVAVVCRQPAAAAATRLDRRESEAFVPVAIIGEALVVPPVEGEPDARAWLQATARGRLLDAAQGGDGWTAEVEPWGLALDAVSGDEVQALARRLYRMLLATLEPAGEGVRQQLEQPVAEIEGADSQQQRLFLLADYVFERQDVRLQALTAETAVTLRDLVADALELAEQGVPHGPGSLKEPLRGYLEHGARAGLADFGRTARVVRTLAPLVDPPAAVRAELERLTAELEALEERFDRAVVKLLKPRRQKR